MMTFEYSDSGCRSEGIREIGFACNMLAYVGGPVLYSGRSGFLSCKCKLVLKGFLRQEFEKEPIPRSGNLKMV